MRTLWSRIATRIDSATLRERVMIFGALAVLVLALADTVLFSPELAKQKRLNREVAQRQSDMAALQEQVTKLVEARQSSPAKSLRARLEQLQREVQAAEAAIAEEQRRFTRPDQMRAALEQMVGRHRNIALVELRSLPAGVPQTPATDQKGVAKPERPVYRHAFEVTVAGRYLDLLAYVAALETMPTRLYWASVHLEASEYPEARLKLVIFTLSLDKGWLSV
jgi:MSHA biogenesis protein MshJ